MPAACRARVCFGTAAVLVLTALWYAEAREDCAACAKLLPAGLSHRATAAALGGERTLGTQKLAILRVDFDDLPGAPRDTAGVFTADRLLDIVNHYVAPFYEAASYGLASVALERAAISEVLRLPEKAEVYVKEPQLQSLQFAAQAAAEKIGFDLASYNRVAVLMSSLAEVPGSRVSYSGFAWIGGRDSWFQGNFSPALVAHELGHSLGLDHASLWEVPQGKTDPLDPAGTKNEYGHAYDLMGKIRHESDHRNVFSPASLRALGWIPQGAVRTVTADGRYRVYQFDRSLSDFNQTLGLRVPLDDQLAYWFSHRRGYPQLRDGLVVERVDEVRHTSLLLDMVPGGTLGDAALKKGQVFSEDVLGITARVADSGESEQGPWIDLDVAFLPQILFRQVDLTALEADGGVDLHLERQRTSTGRVVVQWETVEGTATASADFASRSGTVVWSEEDFSPKRISIPIVNDGVEEHEESFGVRLTGIMGAVAPVREAVIHVVEPGAIDPSFESPEINGVVRTLALQGDGSVVVGGDFSQLGKSFARGAARLLPTGALDASYGLKFGVGASKSSVYRIAVDTLGRSLFGGGFGQFEGESVGGLVRVLPQGVIDHDFDYSGFNGTVRDLALLPTGGVYVAGDFSVVSGHVTPGIARVHADGRIDPSWVSSLPRGSLVTAMAVMPDFRLLVGGRFPTEGGESFWGIMRLHVDGTTDRVLVELEDSGGGVHEALQITRMVRTPSDGVIVVGDFSGFGGLECRGVASLTPSLEVDEAFLRNTGLGPNGKIWDAAVNVDGRIALVGSFNWFDGRTRHGVARLATDGSLDDWDPGARLKAALSWSAVKGTAIALQADGGVLLGLTDLLEREGRLARVASGSTDLPGIVEFESVSWEGELGTDVILPVLRHHGDRGEATVRYVVRAESHGSGLIHAFPTGRLFWSDGDTQPKTIRTAIPRDSAVSVVEVQLLDASGGVQTGLQNTARIVVKPTREREIWLATHFGGSPGAGAGAVFLEPESDADDDGVSNLIEYALDRDPHRGSDLQGLKALPRVMVGAQGPATEHCLVLQVDLPTTLRSDLRYEILVSDGTGSPEILASYDHQLGEWVMNLGGGSSPEIVPATEEGRRLIRFHDVVSVTQRQRRFMQLRVAIEE